MQAYTGTVNQDIDVAKLADGLRDLRFALIGIRNVAFESDSRGAGTIDISDGLLCLRQV